MGAVRRVIIAAALVAAIACGKPAPTPAPATAAPAAADVKRYPVSGQILVVNAEKQSLSIKHHDIVGFMPAMTMTFPVARPELMKGREPGEMILATLEVDDSSARLVDITRTGMEPLPARAAGGANLAIAPGDTAPDAALIDQHDKRRAFAEWRGTPTLVTFIYTRCPLPNYCPLMDKQFAAIQKAGAADPALRGQFRLVSASFDPANDTPAVLTAHAKKLGADPAVWTFVTADAVTIDRFAAKFGVAVTREGGAPGEITHNLSTALIGRDGRLIKIYSGNEWTVPTVLADLRAAAAAPVK